MLPAGDKLTPVTQWAAVMSTSPCLLATTLAVQKCWFRCPSGLVKSAPVAALGTAGCRASAPLAPEGPVPDGTELSATVCAVSDLVRANAATTSTAVVSTSTGPIHAGGFRTVTTGTKLAPREEPSTGPPVWHRIECLAVPPLRPPSATTVSVLSLFCRYKRGMARACRTAGH